MLPSFCQSVYEAICLRTDMPIIYRYLRAMSLQVQKNDEIEWVDKWVIATRATSAKRHKNSAKFLMLLKKISFHNPSQWTWVDRPSPKHVSRCRPSRAKLSFYWSRWPHVQFMQPLRHEWICDQSPSPDVRWLTYCRTFCVRSLIYQRPFIDWRVLFDRSVRMSIGLSSVFRAVVCNVSGCKVSFAWFVKQCYPFRHNFLSLFSLHGSMPTNEPSVDCV
jgi:hypothetical protein